MTAGANAFTQPNPEEQLRLTLRILEHWRVAGEERPVLLPRGLPDDIPLHVPMPEGAALVGSRVSERDVEIYVDTALSPDEALDYYRGAFRAMGWRVRLSKREEPFATLEDKFGDDDEAWLDEVEAFVSPDEQFEVSVSAHETVSAVTSVLLYIGGVWAQEEDPGEEAAARMVEILPDLPPPAESEYWEIAFFGSPDAAARYVVVASDLDTQRFAAHYAEEIAGEGWSETDGEVGKRSAWNTWEREDESGRRLYLAWLAFSVPGGLPMYNVVAQVGLQSGGLPEWSWGGRPRTDGTHHEGKPSVFTCVECQGTLSLVQENEYKRLPAVSDTGSPWKPYWRGNRSHSRRPCGRCCEPWNSAMASPTHGGTGSRQMGQPQAARFDEGVRDGTQNIGLLRKVLLSGETERDEVS
jgi:hypothetical protein